VDKMGGKNKGNRIFRSIEDFKKEYFPDTFEKEKKEKPTDAHELGISFANESLEKIRNQLAD
jgi:hypothetical protein